MATFKRKKIYVDHHVQRALLRQIVYHWAMLLAVLLCVVAMFEFLKSGFGISLSETISAAFTNNGAMLLAIIVMAPIILYESIKLSHRFAGPMVSFRRSLQLLGDGEKVEPVYFRENDFWKDLAENLNRVVERIEGLEAAAAGRKAVPELAETNDGQVSGEAEAQAATPASAG